MSDAPRKAGIDSVSGFVVAMFAAVLGYLILVACGVVIARREAWRFSAIDGLYWIAAMAIPIAQYHTSIRYEESVAGFRQRPLGFRMLANLIAAAVGWVAAHSLPAL